MALFNKILSSSSTIKNLPSVIKYIYNQNNALTLTKQEILKKNLLPDAECIKFDLIREKDTLLDKVNSNVHSQTRNLVEIKPLVKNVAPSNFANVNNLNAFSYQAGTSASFAPLISNRNYSSVANCMQIKERYGNKVPVYSINRRHYARKKRNKKRKCLPRAKCPKMLSPCCEPPEHLKCATLKHTHCCKQEAPYPAYSEYCVEEVIAKGSECKICPWPPHRNPHFEFQDETPYFKHPKKPKILGHKKKPISIYSQDHMPSHRPKPYSTSAVHRGNVKGENGKYDSEGYLMKDNPCGSITPAASCPKPKKKSKVCPEGSLLLPKRRKVRRPPSCTEKKKRKHKGNKCRDKKKKHKKNKCKKHKKKKDACKKKDPCK